MNRRDFLKYCTALGATVAVERTSAYATGLPTDKRNDFPLGMLLIDSHAHPDIFPCSPSFCDQASTLEKINKLRMNASCFATIGDSGNGTPYSFIALLKNLDTIIQRENHGEIRIIRRPADIPLNALSPFFIPGALLAVEGGTPLGGDADLVNVLHDMGVRLITLMHYMVNDIGDIKTQAPIHGGLTVQGGQIVERMMSLGMIVDVAHAHFFTLQGVAEFARANGFPIIDSHTSLIYQPNYGNTRRRSWEEMEMIAETGGMIGTWPVQYSPNRADIFGWARENLEITKRLGIEHIGLGTDGGGIGNLAPLVDGYKSVLDLPKLVAAMDEVGFKRNEIEAYMGGNIYRIIKKCIG